MGRSVIDSERRFAVLETESVAQNPVYHGYLATLVAFAAIALIGLGVYVTTAHSFSHPDGVIVCKSTDEAPAKGESQETGTTPSVRRPPPYYMT